MLVLYQDEESNGASLSCSIRRGVKAGRDLQVTRCLSTKLVKLVTVQSVIPEIFWSSDS